MPRFRAKARAVELLGKGQIADLPTAISELWKNGYDAYGDKLEAFLYTSAYTKDNPVFVVSDDGIGMSREDIINKWFVLGTDSKSRNEEDKKGSAILNKSPRVKMGEKGIGRLAVAYLGPQMLMLTKKPNYPLEAVFFDWRILDNYNLFLEDITIPTKTVEGLAAIQTIFENLKDEFLENFPLDKEQEKIWEDQKELRKTIISDTKALELYEFLVNEQIEELLKSPQKHATKFIIFQPDQQLLELQDFTKNDETSDAIDQTNLLYTVSSLVALFNLFKKELPEYKTTFWVVNESGKYDLLNFKEFFSYRDFKACDHYINGVFDENGNFTGNVRIYKKEIKHTFVPVRKKRKAGYGCFNLEMGYIAGRKDETLLNEEQWRLYEEKLDIYGGLYIYRDGFRVLPYGRVDNDFLEFEERRGKHAGIYFFAKRRMFGYIEISRNENGKLKDKSSREGFVNNAAYREFKSDLIDFFIDLAKRYFSTTAEFNYKDDQKEELKKIAYAETQEKQKEIEARKEFSKKLRDLPEELSQLQIHYSLLMQELQSKTESTDILYDDIKSLMAEIEECRIKSETLKIKKPLRYKPTPNQLKTFTVYQKQLSGFSEEIASSEAIIKNLQEKLKIHDLFMEFQNKYQFYKNILASQFNDYYQELDKILKNIDRQLQEEQSLSLQDFHLKYESIVPNPSDRKDIKNSIVLLENLFNDTRQKTENRIQPFIGHLANLSLDVDEDNLVGYYKAQFEEMKEEWSKTYELAQLGIAVEIIDHQFNTLYSQLATNIASLKDDMLPTKEAANKYKSLLYAFEHLEDNYKLLQPLYRTTGRVRKEVTGKDLFDYTYTFFEQRLKENQISFIITEEAKKWKAFSFESIFKPVLINLVNNAIYWLQPVDQKKIIIDTINSKLVIMNSGLPIDDVILENIFKLFYSERPKGRGIGLYLAKKSLNGIGFEISATNDKLYNKLKGAAFIIENTIKK